MTDLPPVDGPSIPPPPTADQRTDVPAAADACETRHRRSPLIRSGTDRYLAGVAGGGGNRLGLDPFFLRIGLAGLTLLLARNGGDDYIVVPLAYLVAWLTFPTETERCLLRRINQVTALQEAAGAIALFVLTLILLDRPSLVWAGILLAIAALLLSGRPPGSRVGPVETVPEPQGPEPLRSVAPEPGETDRARATTWGRSLRGALGPRPVDGTSRPPMPRRALRSPALWPLTMSLLFAFGFICVMLDNLLDPGLDPSIAVNGALLIIGGVLLLAGWRGRAWITALLVPPLVLPWIAFSGADVPRFGDSSLAVGAIEPGSTLRWSKGYGELYANLTLLDLPTSGDITAEVRVTAGKADVWIPKEAELHVVGHLGAGQIEVYLEEEYLSQDLDPLVDWGLDRTYRARGRECQTVFTDDAGLVAVATWSGVGVPAGASGSTAAEAIADAGYPAPVSQIETHEEIVYDDVTGESLYDDDANLRTQTVRTKTWTFQSNLNDGLCLPTPPPDDPLRITIDATIGLGALKVHRI